MQVYIELWNATPKWRDLPVPERATFIDKVGSSIQALATAGVECLGFGFSEPAPQQAEYDFFAVWTAESRTGIERLEMSVFDAGWFEFFEQVNVTGQLYEPETVLTQHILARHDDSIPVPCDRARRFVAAKKRIEINDHTMAYTDVGVGDPIVFIHGEVTSSWLWRDIVPYLSDTHRCVCIDLMGMGDSDKIDSKEAERYSFLSQANNFEAFMAKLGIAENVVLVAHDWGTAIAFEWARRNSSAVAGIAYMEPIVPPLTWETWDPRIVPLFKQIKSPAGEALILDHNLFVEALQVGVLNPISDDVMNEYRRPFQEPGESRRPTLAWPRSVPLDGEEALWAPINRYCEYLAGSDVPKLAFVPEPGGLLTGERLAWCRRLRNQTEITVSGVHWLTEDSPESIGAALSSWLGTLASDSANKQE